MADYYKQRHLSPKERDEAAAALTLLGLAIAGTVTITAAGIRNRKGVGVLQRDTQTSFDYIFDDELALYKQEERTPYDPAMHPDIEKAYKDMALYRSYRFTPEEYVDAETGDEYPADTVFEVYKIPRYSSTGQLSLVHAIEGDDLINATRIMDGDIAKAKKFGYDLYIYQNGDLAKFVPGVYGVKDSQQAFDFDAAPDIVPEYVPSRDAIRQRRLEDARLHRLGFKVYAGENNDLVYCAGCRK